MIGFHGFFGKSIMVIDLDLIKQMLIKDFDYFVDKPIFDLGNKYLNSVLTQIEGDDWRRARHASTPVFTSGKMKKMSKMRSLLKSRRSCLLRSGNKGGVKVNDSKANILHHMCLV